MDVNVEFRKVIPITKAWEDDGELYIEGESSGPEIDLDEQFMTKECVADMAAQINAVSIPFGYYDEHNKRGILSELGAVVSAEITPEWHMRNRVRLDKDNPAAVTLHNKIRKGKQFGMSIAGNVKELAKKVISDKLYQGFNRIRLDHIANTTKPSWSPSLGTLVAKSLEADGFDWNDAPNYDGEIFAVVEKRSKPDPKAGKGYMLVEELLRRLNEIFGWESYQERIAEDNRDAIPLQDHEVIQQLWPPAIVPVEAPTKAFDPEDEEVVGFIQKAVDMPVSASPYELKQVAEAYERVYYLIQMLKERDARDGKKTNKAIITKLKAALAAISKVVSDLVSKSQAAPQPLVYGQENVQETTEEGSMPQENVIKDFSQVDQSAIGQPPLVQKPAEPSVGKQPGQKLTSFDQVAKASEGQAARITGEQPAEPESEVAKVPEAVSELADGFGEFIKKVFASGGTPAEKQAALMQGGQAFYGELGQMLEAERPEADRLQEAVQKAIAPLAQKIESLEAQLAAAKTQKSAEPSGEPELVRKSLVIGVEPSRVVKQQNEAPTFQNLVRWPYGGGAAPDFPDG